MIEEVDDFDLNIEDIDIEEEVEEKIKTKSSKKDDKGKKKPLTSKQIEEDLRSELKEVEPGAESGVSEEDEELTPWTGRARDYKGDPNKVKPKKLEPSVSKKEEKLESTKTSKSEKKSENTSFNSGNFNLVLSQISDKKKKQKAAELIVELKGGTIKEALALTENMIISVLKGVSKEDAENVLARFKNIQITGRVTEKK